MSPDSPQTLRLAFVGDVGLAVDSLSSTLQWGHED